MFTAIFQSQLESKSKQDLREVSNGVSNKKSIYYATQWTAICCSVRSLERKYVPKKQQPLRKTLNINQGTFPTI